MEKCIKIPLQKGQQGFFETTKNQSENTRQKIYVLISTEPGERVMESDYGAGLKKFLFMQEDPFLKNRIKAYLEDKFKKYLPEVRLDSVSIEFIDNSLIVELSCFFNGKLEIIKYRVK